MVPSEMARRVRHDLIKHLDIPEPDRVLTADEVRVLYRRLFDSATGLSRLGAVWGYKLRHDDGWCPELESCVKTIESACAVIAKRETLFQRLRINGGVLPADFIDDLKNAVQAVHDFESACQSLDAAGNEDEQAAFDFFQFSKPVENNSQTPGISTDSDDGNQPKSDSCDVEISSDSNGKKRLLVVDDHLISIDRLQAHPTFQKRFTWATLCGRTRECCECSERETCTHRRARTYGDVVRGLMMAREQHRKVDALLMDVRFDDLSGDELVWLPEMPSLNREDHVKALQGLIIARQLRKMPEFRQIPIILMTSRSRLPDGAASLLEGLEGLQFVDDEDSLDALASRVESVIRLGLEAPIELGYFWGSSPRIQQVRRQIEIMSLGPRTVFITGPSGSGKSSLVEQIIYPLSGRHRMVTLDLSSVPDTLVESELFGHVKGAFSGASHDRVGLIEEADGGILFLDEIGNLSPENQRKLLLFLQDKMVRRVGAAHETRRHVDVKVVVATHLDLSEEVAAGKFRFDLYMRFGPAMRIALPALCERRDDLPSMVETLALRIIHGEEMKPHIAAHRRRTGAGDVVRIDFAAGIVPGHDELCVRFKPATRELFLDYAWPGNTRELESVLDALILKALYDLQVSESKSRIIEIDHYYALSLIGGIDKNRTEVTIDSNYSYKSNEYDVNCGIGKVSDFAELRKLLEQRYLQHVFEASRGNLARMGEMLFGDDSAEMQHKITMRLNQLGLSVRKMKKECDRG
ncbi:MAG: sigma-54-dependent Fis family transcriptional regulator [Proteobacteria bacterium]|nr:sigma-54-dependent Fis family transcriptional regulator [Pseudomonadota bacterium]